MELAATRARLSEALTQISTLSAALLAVRNQVVSVPVVVSSPARSSAAYYGSRPSHTPAPAAPVLATAPPHGDVGQMSVATAATPTRSTRAVRDLERQRTLSDAELDAECVRRILFDPRLSAVLQAIHSVPSHRGSFGVDAASITVTRSQPTTTASADCLHRTVEITAPAAEAVNEIRGSQSGGVDTTSQPASSSAAHSRSLSTDWEDGISEASLPPAAAFVFAASTKQHSFSPGQALSAANAQRIPWTSASSDEDE